MTWRIIKKITWEFSLGIATGSFPLLLSRYFGLSDEEIVNALTSTTPADYILLYFFLLLVVNGVFALATQWAHKHHLPFLALLDSVHTFFYEISSLLHSVFRAVLGAVAAIIGILMFDHGVSQALLELTSVSFIVISGCLLGSLVSVKLRTITAPKSSPSYMQDPLKDKPLPPSRTLL